MAAWAVGVAGPRASWQNLYSAILGGEPFDEAQKLGEISFRGR